MPISLNATGIDPEEPKYEGFLHDLQGNILDGYGKAYHHTAHIFLRFTDPKNGKEFIQEFSRQYVTSALKQFESRSKEDVLFGNLFLSSSGYAALDLAERCPPDERFRAGMKASQEALNDPDPSGWEKPYNTSIHAMISLANHEDRKGAKQGKKALQDDVRDIEKMAVAKDVQALHNEFGDTLRKEDGRVIEHFGYVDGRSQPLFYKQDIDREERTDGDEQGPYNSSAPLSLVLVRDWNASGEDHFGSYLVFRKLEQNVAQFEKKLNELAAELGKSPEDLAGFVVGRFRDGTPVALQGNAGMEPISNNFNYDDDERGVRCPRHAHIRRMNPRGESPEKPEDERARRIVRRGITYGGRPDLSPRSDPSDSSPPSLGPPRKDVGLLFMCFQRSIKNQFEYLQRRANDTLGGIDPLIGQLKGVIDHPQKWFKEWNNPDRGYERFPFGALVTLKGGEYFFAPSITFLKNIAE